VSIADFRDNDAAFLAWLSAHDNGYVINIGRSERGYARLHRASCGTVTRRSPLTGPYIKICSVSLAELDQWSARRPGATVSNCGTCHPRAGTQAGLAPGQVTRLAEGALIVPPASTTPGPETVGAGWEIDGPGSLGEVWLWADRYIPYDQLTPAMRDARAALRSAVRSLAPGSGEILDASYAGHKPANMDVENLVLYNIDAAAGGCFAPAARHGVRFELAAAPRRSPPSGRAQACSYRYRLVSPTSEFSYWRPTRRLARFTDATLGAFPASRRLEQAWLAIHRAEAETVGTGAGAGRPFAVFLTLDFPRGTTVSVGPELVKALIDGTVAAFQGSSATDRTVQAAARVAAATGEQPGLITQLLTDSTRAVLGATGTLVHLRGEGVQWNPADHLCVAGQLLTTQTAGKTWALSGASTRSSSAADQRDGHRQVRPARQPDLQPNTSP
jgi:hypothetical protein